MRQIKYLTEILTLTGIQNGEGTLLVHLMSYKLTWVDRTHSLPLKEEYYDRHGELYRVFTADEVKEINGFPTITGRTMKNLKSGHRTEVQFSNTEYNLGMDEKLFTERFLRRPPKKWIK